MRKSQNFILWFTGLPGSGKTTLAQAVVEEFKQYGIKAKHIDGDQIRAAQKEKLGFSVSDRDRNIRQAIKIVAERQRAGYSVVASFISPYRRHRIWAIGSLSNCLEVFVDAPLEVCKARDPKGMYKKALNGEIMHFTGIDDPYEHPFNPDIYLSTDVWTISECVKKIITTLKDRGFIGNFTQP